MTSPTEELQRLDAYEQRIRNAIGRKRSITKRKHYGVWFAFPHRECVLLAECMAKSNELRAAVRKP